jgi:hypothetical protein
MATSAPFVRFLSQGSVWQIPSEDPVRESEDAAISVEADILTESESRRADIFVGEVGKMVEGLNDEQPMEELVRQ